MIAESGMVGHLEDDQFVRLLDDEVSPEERTTWNAHLERCGECLQQFDELTGASAWFSANVAALDTVRAPDDLTRARALARVREGSRSPTAKASVRAVSPLPRIAAGIAILVAFGFSVQPVRAWIVSQIQRLAGVPVAEEIAPAPVPAPLVAGAPVNFRPTGGTFVIELGEAQAGGELTISSVSTEQASAQIMGGSEESLIVQPSGLRVQNVVGSSASYRVNLPAGLVQRVEVRVGGVVIARQDVGAAPEVVTLDLAPSAPNR